MRPVVVAVGQLPQDLEWRLFTLQQKKLHLYTSVAEYLLGRSPGCTAGWMVFSPWVWLSADMASSAERIALELPVDYGTTEENGIPPPILA